MKPPYPKVSPTYKQTDGSDMIKLDLIVCLPLERSVRYLLLSGSLQKWYIMLWLKTNRSISYRTVADSEVSQINLQIAI